MILLRGQAHSLKSPPVALDRSEIKGKTFGRFRRRIGDSAPLNIGLFKMTDDGFTFSGWSARPRVEFTRTADMALCSGPVLLNFFWIQCFLRQSICSNAAFRSDPRTSIESVAAVIVILLGMNLIGP